MLKVDMEREYMTDMIYLGEDRHLYREPAKVTVKLNFKTKKNENRNNTSSLPRASEESVQSGHDIPIDTPF
jgi:hypothetical protein